MWQLRVYNYKTMNDVATWHRLTHHHFSVFRSLTRMTLLLLTRTELISVRKLDLRVRHRGQVESSKIDRRVLDISITYINICAYIYICTQLIYIYCTMFVFCSKTIKSSPIFSRISWKVSGDELVIIISLFAILRNLTYFLLKYHSFANIEYTIKFVWDSKKRKKQTNKHTNKQTNVYYT